MAKIKTSEERLRTIVKETVLEAFGSRHDKQVELPDKCDLDGAFKYLTHDLGFTVRKSVIYKLTAKKEIPCQRFGNRLVFSRKNLKTWFENQLEQKPQFNASLELSKSAQRKLKK